VSETCSTHERDMRNTYNVLAGKYFAKTPPLGRRWHELWITLKLILNSEAVKMYVRTESRRVSVMTDWHRNFLKVVQSSKCVLGHSATSSYEEDININFPPHYFATCFLGL